MIACASLVVMMHTCPTGPSRGRSPIALADYLLAPPRRIIDPVLEIGAGLGITGLALALFGHRVVISDYDEDALAFIQASALLNDVRLDEVKLLDWRDPPADHFPTIVAADCAYTRAAQPAIAALLATCLSPGGSGYFSDMNRRGADSFVDAVRDATLDCLTTPITCKPIPRADAIDKRTLKARIFHITRRGSTPNGAEADQGQRVDSNGQPPSSGGGGGSHLVR